MEARAQRAARPGLERAVPACSPENTGRIQRTAVVDCGACPAEKPGTGMRTQHVSFNFTNKLICNIASTTR